MSTKSNVRRRVSSDNGIERWEARWRDNTGKERQRSFRTKSAAQKFQAERRADEHRGLVRNEDRASRRFQHYADKWLADKATLVRPVTVAGYEKNLRLHVLPHFADMRVGKITTADALQWCDDMKAKPVGDHTLHPSTIKAAYICLDQVLRLAVLDQAIYINPATGIPLPKYHTVVPERPFEARTLTVDEQRALVGAMADRDDTGLDALVTAVLLGSGLRAAELSGLEVGDVSLLNKTLKVARTKTKVTGKAEPVVGEPKSKRSKRTLSLADDLTASLADWLAQHPRKHEPTAPLFPARQSHYRPHDWTRPIEMGTFRQRRLRPALKAAGIPEGLRLHDLRHTYGTTLVKNNTSLEIVSDLMGHASIATTHSLYIHLNPATHHAQVNTLPSLLGDRIDAASAVAVVR